MLSALEGASSRRQELAGEAVSVNGGGQAARMLVISDYGLNTDESRAVGDRLGADAERIGREGGLDTGLTGGAAVINDYGEVTRARIPLVVGAVVIACFLMLLLILRAPLLAAIAVVLNLGSVAAAIGVMALVCKIPEGYPLGGHPYVDTVGAAAIFGVTFGLSIDYAVFLLARMRERYERDGDNRAAIEYGLQRTASVITGAAAIMAAVFISFAAAPVATVSQMGVGLTVAVLLDATVVRIVLLPALMLLFGDRVWHTPALARPSPAPSKPRPERNLRTITYRQKPNEAVQFNGRPARRQQGICRGEQMGRVGGRAVLAVFAVALTAGLIGNSAYAEESTTNAATMPTEGPSRTDYVSELESICKPGAKETQTAMDGVRDDVQDPDRIPIAARKFQKAAIDIRRDDQPDHRRPAAAGGHRPAAEMVRLPQAPGAVPEGNREASSRSATRSRPSG